MHVVVEGRSIQGDERYRIPGVPTKGTPDGNEVPKALHPVVLNIQEGKLTIGVVGMKETGWNWYALFGNVKYFLGGKTSAEAAVRKMLHTESGLKRKSTGSLHPGMPVEDNTL